MQITQKMVRREVLKWRKLLNLEYLDFSIKFGGVSENNYAMVETDIPYLRVEIAFNLDNFKDMKLLRRKIIHELMHVVLCQYAETASVFAGSKRKILTDLEENLVTQIERWELWGKVK